MAYTTGIPLSTNIPAQSRVQIHDNFDALDTFLTINHVSLNAANQGKHKLVTLPEQAADPINADNEMSIYTKVVDTKSQMFLRNEGAAGDIVNFTSATKTNNGTTTLPSGLILKWGNSTTVLPNGIVTIAFVPVFPTALLTINANFAKVGGGHTAADDFMVRIYNYTKDEFSVVGFRITDNARGAIPFSWFAIGY